MPALMAGDDREKSGLQLQIATVDRAIDSLVFRLYDLSSQEILSLRGEANSAARQVPTP
jgi:uncharacterized protein (UPF0276 family)